MTTIKTRVGHSATHLVITACIMAALTAACRYDQDTTERSPEVQFDDSTIKGTEGFFRAGRTAEGQWWFITPDDQPFFYKGVCAVNRAGTAGGRRARDGSYAAVVDEKYGYQAAPDTFVYAQIARLRDWGFNAFGAWTTEEFFDHGMPYTEILELYKEGPFIQLPGDRRPLPDIFDPAWVEAINSKARTLCATKRRNVDLVGYFTDNEIGFGRADDFGMDLGFVNADRFGFSLLRGLLGLDTSLPARKAAWTFVWGRYSDFDELSEAWGHDIKSREDLRILNEKKISIDSESYADDARAFQALYATQYFKTAYQTIKRYDPNHLVLGCRFGAPPDSAILAAMKPWVDVISVNNYRPTLYQRIDYLYEQTGLPVLIGEFSWNPDLFKYVPLHNEPPGGFSIKERVFRKGEQVLLRAASHPAMVGYTWYRWVANTTEGDRFSFGLVDRADREEMHIPLLEKINPKMEDLRLKMTGGPPDLESFDGVMELRLENMRPDWNHVLHFEVTDGQVASKAYGWQMEANNVEGRVRSEEFELNMDVDFKEWYWRGKLALEAGEGRYNVVLHPQGDELHGTYEGTYNGQAVSGTAHGYIIQELPVEWSAGTLFE